MNTVNTFTVGQAVWVQATINSLKPCPYKPNTISVKLPYCGLPYRIPPSAIRTTEQLLLDHGALAPQLITPLFTITLPLPDHRLSPNARVHHMLFAALKKKARAYAHREAIRQLLTTGYTLPATPTHYSINWHYKGIKPDSDNCHASCKAYLDGIADFLGLNDKDLDVHRITRTHNKQQPHLAITYFAKIRLENMTSPELADKLYRQLLKACETWEVLDHRIYEGDLLDITMTLNNYLKAATSHAGYLTDKLADIENH